MNAPSLSRRLAAAAVLFGVAFATLVSASNAVPEPMMDYGVGQFATIEQYSGAARVAAEDSYVMDYGVGRYATIAAWAGTGSTTMSATAPAARVLAKR